MSEETQDLVTKIDVIPDLAGLNSFDEAIERAIRKVDQLDAAIKRVNNLKPSSPYAPRSTTGAPSAVTSAAVATIAATGANLVSRTPLADTVRKEAQKVAQAAVQGVGGGVGEKISIPASNLYRLPPAGGGLLPPPVGNSGGFFPPTPSDGNAQNWSTGQAGGLVDPSTLRRNPFNRFDTSTSRFSGEPLSPQAAKKTPVAQGMESASGGSFFSMERMAAGAASVWGAKELFSSLAASMDSIQSQQAQIARLAQTTGDASEAFFTLNAAASDVRSDSGAFISTYTNMATATQKLGLSQDETIKATEGLVSSLQLGGGSAEAVNAALYQMGQAFSSDRFGGDEFRSFMEAIGTMAPEVAKAFGTDVKGLRAMSEQGKLTAETMVKAFQKLAATNLDLLKKQGWTWGQTTTVMKNDWQAFLAQATIDGDWHKFTDWAANTLIPVAREAEQEVAEFWSSLADESKTAILIGILGAVGAAFTALAIPVLAALWPFLAIGAAVWLVYEAFVEWKAWLNGEGGTIFDSLFGSFDAFEKRYPAIMRMLRALSGASDDAQNNVNNGGIWSGEEKNQSWKELWKPQNLFPNAGNFLTGRGNDFNPLNGIEKFLNFFGEDSKQNISTQAPQAKGNVIINNEIKNENNISVPDAKDVGPTVEGLNKTSTSKASSDVNWAESSGAV